MVGSALYENMLNYIDAEPTGREHALQSKVLKLLLIIGRDHGTKVLRDAVGYKGPIWLNKAERAYSGDFVMTNLITGVREYLEEE